MVVALVALLLAAMCILNDSTKAFAASACQGADVTYTDALGNNASVSLPVNLPPPLPTLNFIGSIVVRVVIGGSEFVRLQTLNSTVELGPGQSVTYPLPETVMMTDICGSQ